ncbi:MAG: PRC-barrel domain containing protein [Ignavibacteriales bacterium]|nr:MAG: PRC-barrel domain containing protein [Ignavibacteriales bacterium]
MQALSAATLTGDKVTNRAGEDLGKIEEIMLDTDEGRIAYAVVSFGGFLGIGDKYFAIPWKTLKLDTDNKQFLLDVPKERLENAPGFDKNNWPKTPDYNYMSEIYKHYDVKSYW